MNVVLAVAGVPVDEVAKAGALLQSREGGGELLMVPDEARLRFADADVVLGVVNALVAVGGFVLQLAQWRDEHKAGRVRNAAADCALEIISFEEPEPGRSFRVDVTDGAFVVRVTEGLGTERTAAWRVEVSPRDGAS